MTIELIKAHLREVPDFPTEGILFKDITPILENPQLFKETIQIFKERLEEFTPEVIVGIESRGFIFAAPLAVEMGIPFVLARKPGKLPSHKISVEYSLEYGSDSLEIHKDSIENDQKVAIVDDLLATGGTSEAAVKLVKSLGGNVVSVVFLVELISLKGRERISPINLISLLKE
tara:strand:- start:34940 stop:35461 length:522 start_codon:yes stop_codon:yes gene_type:complete